eukprot:765341-Hanusia_phi.AAC.2
MINVIDRTVALKACRAAADGPGPRRGCAQRPGSVGVSHRRRIGGPGLAPGPPGVAAGARPVGP